MPKTIENPILPGFHPDPCVCRRGNDYYLAVSSFEWLPGVPVYHSRDLLHWELYTHILGPEQIEQLCLLPSAKGVWAPCLSWCESDGLFYLTYSVMYSMNARYFDVSNYLISAPSITGPWSRPVYLHSAGFDASLFHDDDGRKYLVSLEWETRQSYEKPGAICLTEYDPEHKRLIGPLQRIYWGGTDRGCIEGPHIYKRAGWYYLMCAEGGTGYAHCVTMARSRSVWGPYEPDPENPILSSVPGEIRERQDWDHLKPRYYNPQAALQKAGHGSLVESSLGECFLFHLCARPFVPELRCTLGRETAVQRMYWTQEGWLRLESGGCLCQKQTRASDLPDHPLPQLPATDNFEGNRLRIDYYAPRWHPERFASVTARPGWLRLEGKESLCSLHETAFVARKLRSVYCDGETLMDFNPENYHQSAGLALYYDNMNYAYLELCAEEPGHPLLRLRRLDNGLRLEYGAVQAPAGPLRLRVELRGRQTRFLWAAAEGFFTPIGPVLDSSCFSDEYCKYGEFTGTFVGLACEDSLLHEKAAWFQYFTLQELDPDSAMAKAGEPN